MNAVTLCWYLVAGFGRSYSFARTAMFFNISSSGGCFKFFYDTFLWSRRYFFFHGLFFLTRHTLVVLVFFFYFWPIIFLVYSGNYSGLKLFTNLSSVVHSEFAVIFFLSCQNNNSPCDFFVCLVLVGCLVCILFPLNQIELLLYRLTHIWNDE